jgi:tripartite-type tricarboxylate transporter receptor subunit TctC
VFDRQRIQITQKITDKQAWSDLPTCREAGLPTDYLMLRGIFMPGGVKQDEVNYYIDLLKKVRETPDWKDFSEKAAFNQTFMTGQEYVKWLTDADAKHKTLMEKAGFLAKK